MPPSAVRRAGAERSKMRRICFSVAIAAAAILGGLSLTTPATAAPPTVTPSPGYDARLQEQRATQASSAPVHEPAPRVSGPLPRHRAKRDRHGAR